MKIIEKEFNALTGQETITEREETTIEKAERLATEKRIAEQIAEAEVRAKAKAELLERFGLSADEAKLLLA